MARLTRPLFSFDAGWLFIAAGLAVCAAGVILPAQGDLRALRFQLDQLRGEESRAYARLKAHSDFMDQVDRADPALIRRLAATQLNLVPQGDTPVLLASAPSPPVTNWIDGTVKTDLRPPTTTSDSILSSLANGPHRLWMIGSGIMSVFIGLMLAPISWRGRRAADLERPLVEAPLAGPARLMLPPTDVRDQTRPVQAEQTNLQALAVPVGIEPAAAKSEQESGLGPSCADIDAAMREMKLTPQELLLEADLVHLVQGADESDHDSADDGQDRASASLFDATDDDAAASDGEGAQANAEQDQDEAEGAEPEIRIEPSPHLRNRIAPAGDEDEE